MTHSFELLTKPHGHGDVHLLLHSEGVAAKWLASGIQWIGFLQDTNALVFRTMVASIGVSVAEGFACNSMTGPREVSHGCISFWGKGSGGSVPQILGQGKW